MLSSYNATYTTMQLVRFYQGLSIVSILTAFGKKKYWDKELMWINLINFINLILKCL